MAERRDVSRCRIVCRHGDPDEVGTGTVDRSGGSRLLRARAYRPLPGGRRRRGAVEADDLRNISILKTKRSIGHGITSNLDELVLLDNVFQLLLLLLTLDSIL